MTRDSSLNGRTLNDDLEIVLLKPHFVVVANKLEVCGTNNRK